MAKKKSTTNQPAQIDSVFGAALSAARERFGDGVAVGSANEVLQVGLPLPSLAVRYLFQANIFPLGRVWQLAGQEGSCKTSLLNELLRWHLLFGGGGVIMENENKESEVLRHGMLEYNKAWIEQRVHVIPTNSLDEWQLALTSQVDIFAAEMDRKGGPGRVSPILFGIDSLTATDTQSNIDKVNKEGFASRGYAEQANLISRYMRTMPQRMRDYPFTVVGTNHLKPATDYMGRPTSNVPGGKAVPFMATFMIESKRISDIELENYQGIRLNLKMTKNSLGPSRRDITVELLWWWAVDPSDGVAKQHFHWDWYTATVEMLLSIEKTSKTKFKLIKEITGLQVKASQKKVYSSVLGISEENAVHYRDWGRALEARPDVMTQLYPVLGIGTYRLFQAGVDFRTLQQQSREEAAHANSALYAHPEAMPEIDADDIDPMGEVDMDYEEEGV